MTTTTTSKFKTILTADCGSATTTVLLIEAITGHYRLAATAHTLSTWDRPWRDVTVGLTAAIRQIEQETGRTLLAPDGRPILPKHSNGQGVDIFAVVSSAGPPLAVALVGLTDDISLASARRATATTYARITSELSLKTDHRQVQRPLETRLQLLQAGRPEVILLVGGVDGGAQRPIVEMANLITMMLQVAPDIDQPHLLYAGNVAAQSHLAETLGPIAALKLIDNVRPSLETENLAAVQVELETLYLHHKLARLPGFEKLQNWTPWPAMPTARSFEKVVTFLGQQNNLNVIGLNLGSLASQVSAYVPGQQPVTTLRTDSGMGHGLAPLLNHVPLERFRRWLPFEIAPGELYNQILNKSLYPAGLPTTPAELYLDYAIAREALRFVVEPARAGWPRSPAGLPGIHWNLIIAAGRTLTTVPQLGYSALMILDSLEPWGISKIVLDVAGLTNVLGALAVIEPVAAVEVATHANAFLNLGAVIAPFGHGPAGKTALKLKFMQDETEPVELDIPYGVIQQIDLPPGQKATVEIRPTRFFDIGLGQPGRGAIADVEGGVLGLIVDTRGRPLRLSPNDEQRREQLQQWLVGLGVRV